MSLKDEQFTDNTKFTNFEQCKDCKYRDGRGTDWDWMGFQKVTCQMFMGAVTGFYKPLSFDGDLMRRGGKTADECPFYEEDTEIENTAVSPFSDEQKKEPLQRDPFDC